MGAEMNTPGEKMPSLDEMRKQLSELRAFIEDSVAMGSDGKILAELVLAKRHIEDARMRLGVAEAMENGYDPWVHRIMANGEEQKPAETAESKRGPE